MAWHDELVKPHTALGLFLAILSIILGLYFGLSRPVPVISWRQSTFRIADRSSGTAGLTALRASGQPMRGNVYASQITIWNSGDDAAGQERVRKLVRIELPEADYISDFRIIAAYPSIDNFAVQQIEARALRLQWKHLDPKDGVKLSLIFSAERDMNPMVQGDIYPGRIVESQLSNGRNSLWAVPPVFAITLVAVLLAMEAVTLLWRRYAGGHRSGWPRMALQALASGMVSTLVAWGFAMLSQPPSPPF